MKTIIAVIGSDQADSSLSKKAVSIAKEVGRLVAKRGGVLSCGGRGGIMEAACQGACEEQGLTIGILPDSKDEANSCVDIGLPTGMGTRRNFLVVNTCDAIIAIGGRWGTLNEMTFSAIMQKPLILIRGTGGSVDLLCESELIHTHPYCVIVESAEEAVHAAWDYISKN